MKNTLDSKHPSKILIAAALGGIALAPFCHAAFKGYAHAQSPARTNIHARAVEIVFCNEFPAHCTNGESNFDEQKQEPAINLVDAFDPSNPATAQLIEEIELDLMEGTEK